MPLQKDIIAESKYFIDIYDLGELQNLYKQLISYETDVNLNKAFIFKEVFLYACKKMDKAVISWMMEVYDTFDDISKIGLRQTFFYGKYIIKSLEIRTWYETTIVEPIRN